MADWIKVIKPQVEDSINKAKLTDKNAIKLIMNFERRLNTCRNYLENGGSWSGMCELKANGDAYFLLEDLREFHSHQWNKYLEINGYVTSANLGDFLA